MLVSMTVRNIALIEHLEIQFQKGMHVLSGETGAGKSIIIDSINLILGERADRSLIRSGCEKAAVEALFDISHCPQVKEMLAEQQLDAEDGLMTVQRELTSGNRNICRVCGVIVPLTFLRSLTSHLVDIHGQHEHQSLLDSTNHLGFLDSFGDDEFKQQKEQVALAYRTWKESSSKFSALRKKNLQLLEKQSFLETRVKELDALQLETGEAERLLEEKQRYASAEKIDSSLRNAYEAAAGISGQGAVSQLKASMEALGAIADLDPSFRQLSERIKSLFYEAEEISIELRAAIEAQNFDPERYETIQDRLDQIRRLERRYGMTADELSVYHEQIKDELSTLDSMNDRLKRAEGDFKQKLQKYRSEASELTAKRQELASVFEKSMEAELKELGMQNTRFACVFEETAPGQKKIPTANGDDVVCFYIAPNPGEPLKPLDKTASGGELSRLMLALKAVGAAHDHIPCMIFDEIDTGISGHIAGVVAEKMGSIARYHQVLCVTHLAQIAAMADVQYLVQKKVIGERTCTNVDVLHAEERIAEVARLIGVTTSQQESGFAHARAILDAAAVKKAAWKMENF